MAFDRTLTVRLRAVADSYHRVLDQAARKAEEFASKTDRITAWGAKAESVGKKMTLGLTVPIAAAGAAAVAVVGDFDASMREVGALTSATAGEMNMMREAAIQMGADTQFSATEAADAMSQLVKGGFDARQATEALPAVMQLAAAATIDIASAADIATNVLSVFGLEVADLARVNDYLAQAANSSDTDVRELGEAFKYVGPIAKGAGLSLEETTATMALMAEAGIRGSMAGTSLRGILTGLLSPSAKVAKTLSDLGVNVVDSSGRITSMVDVIDQLKASGATAGQIMEIFGDRAGPAMVALLDMGSGALKRYTDSIRESGGVAQNLADAKMGGLNGAIEELKGSLETLAIRFGEAGLAGFVSGAARSLTGFTNKLNELPVGVQRAGLSIAGLAAASGPAIWAFGKLGQLYGPVVSGVATGFRSMATAVDTFRYQMKLAEMAGVSTGRALLAMFGPGAAIVAGIAAFAAIVYLSQRAAREFERAHIDAGTAAEGLAESAGIATRELASMNEEAERGVVSSDDWRKKNEDAILTLRELGNLADQQAFLVEVGYQMVLRGATPEQALEEVERLARAAGVRVPVDLTIGNIGDFDQLMEGIRARIERAVTEIDAGTAPWVGELQSDLDSIARAAAEAWQTDNIAGFIQILAEAEERFGSSSEAMDYLVNQALRFTDVSGLSTDEAENLVTALAEMASGASAASEEQKQLVDRIIETAREMDGGLTPANIAAAAAMETAGYNAGEFGTKAAEAGAAAGGAAGGVGDLEGALTDQEQAAQDAEQALSDYIDTLHSSIDPLYGMMSALQSNIEAQAGIAEAEQKLAEARAEGDPTKIAEAERDLAEAHRRAGESALDATVAATELRAAVENGSVSLEDARLMLLAWVDQGLISQETAAFLSESFGLAALQAGRLGHEVDGAKTSLAGLDGSSATVTVGINWQDPLGLFTGGFDWFGLFPRGNGRTGFLPRARGGSVWPGQTFLVGEEGPELVRFSQPGHVTNAADTRRAMAGHALSAGETRRLFNLTGAGAAVSTTTTTDHSIHVGEVKVVAPSPHRSAEALVGGIGDAAWLKRPRSAA